MPAGEARTATGRGEKIGRRDRATVTWRKPEPTAADHPAPKPDATGESAGRDNRKRTATRTSVGLIALGALIVAIHLGIALAALFWTGRAADTVFVVVLVMLGVLGGHLALRHVALGNGRTARICRALARHRPGRR